MAENRKGLQNGRECGEPCGGFGQLSRIVLTGFMGAGKSTVGPLLARHLGWQFLDLDREIEAAEAKSIASIFKEHGEAYFRELEFRTLTQLTKGPGLVLALGGGAVEHPQALPMLLNQPGTCLVFLDAPLKELLGRIRVPSPGISASMESGSPKPGDPESEALPVRPLLQHPEDLERRHRRRLPYYRASHITIVTTRLTPKQVAARILKQVRDLWAV